MYVWLVAPAIKDPFKYHWFPVAELEDKVPALFVIVGVAGVVLTVTEIVFEVAVVGETQAAFDVKIQVTFAPFVNDVVE